eukprot:TRINITY_DN1927_c0_g1_i1.p1 TRINITY_DN1927_c0_g1~~TRINITY_DN1927_c0_g1_i1.p1  ORF type:complete len:230 (+),score=34.33 TRINITY_DN1927_c0_g1_i1:15-704(+)
MVCWKGVVLALVLLVHCRAYVTVQDEIDAAGCSTAVIAPLSKQLVTGMQKLSPGLFTDLNTLTGLTLSDAAQAAPYLQTTAATALQSAINEGGQVMQINSALRTIAQQLMLYRWYLAGECGITLAAKPGHSNHNGGLAVDVENADTWIQPMQDNNWIKLGPQDPPHFDYKGPGQNVLQLSIKAFQLLWNDNNPNSTITVDGIYGNATETCLLLSPADGWPLWDDWNNIW